MEVNHSIIPSYWDKSRLEDIPMEKGLNPNEENTMNKFAKIELKGTDLEAIQKLFDSTYKKVYTRDRKGAKVPDRLKIVRVERIQNLQNWAEFRSRQQEVLEEIKKTEGRRRERRLQKRARAGTTWHHTGQWMGL